MPRHRTGDDKNALRELRERAEMTQDAAAKAVGVSRSTWSFWELRERPISVTHLNEIQVALGLSDEQVTRLRMWWKDPKGPWDTAEITSDVVVEGGELAPAEVGSETRSGATAEPSSASGQ